MKISAPGIALLTLCLPNFSVAADLAAGKETSAKCVACHGADGIATQAIYPNLAGQQQDYLVLAMKAYRDGERGNDMMKMFAIDLTDTDIENLAAYYNSLR